MSDLSSRRLAALPPEELSRLLAPSEILRDGPSRRLHRRFPYHGPPRTTVIEAPGTGQITSHRVRIRNISEGGMAFLHGGFVHDGSRIAIELENGRGRNVILRGTVVQCRYLEASVHEICVSFDELIRPREFEPTAIPLGILLVVPDRALASIVRHQLVAQDATVEVVPELDAALELLGQRTFEAVILDVDGAEDRVGVFLDALRDVAPTALMIALGDEDAPELARATPQAGWSEAWSKPVPVEVLCGLIDRLSRPPVESRFHDEPSVQPVIGLFAAALPRTLERIHAALQAEDRGTLTTLVSDLVGEAGRSGFDAITEAGRQLIADAGSDRHSLDELHRGVAELEQLCRRIHVPLAA